VLKGYIAKNMQYAVKQPWQESLKIPKG